MVIRIRRRFRPRTRRLVRRALIAAGGLLALAWVFLSTVGIAHLFAPPIAAAECVAAAAAPTWAHLERGGPLR